MFGFLWEMRRYFRQVAGQLALGSAAGIIMNTAVVLPAILLGRAIDQALAWERGSATATDVGWAALAFIGGTLLTEVPRIAKRWWLMTANARIRANVRADAFRGVLAWPMADVQRMPVGDLMARIVGDVEVLGVGVREFTIEIWDTVLFSLSFVVAMLVFDPGLTLLALLPAPFAMVLAHATGILNSFRHPISSGKLEGLNNKVGAMTRAAYGYRDEEFLHLKLYSLHESSRRLTGGANSSSSTPPSRAR